MSTTTARANKVAKVVEAVNPWEATFEAVAAESAGNQGHRPWVPFFEGLEDMPQYIKPGVPALVKRTLPESSWDDPKGAAERVARGLMYGNKDRRYRIHLLQDTDQTHDVVISVGPITRAELKAGLAAASGK